MGANKSATLVPGHGTLFVANVNTAMPVGGLAAVLAAFSLTGSDPAGWTSIGHTSKDNLPAFTKDGGDATFLDSWLADAITAIYASTNWSLGFNPIQIDQAGLDLAFGGTFDTDGGYIVPGSNSGTPKALVLYMTDGTGELLFYIPNTLVAIGDAPSIDAAKFLELPLTASILAADSTVIPAAANGLPGIMKIYKTGTSTAIPTITTALPASQGAGSVVRLTGTGFSSVVAATASNVTVGGVNATSFEILSDSRIDLIMPAGSAGSAPIIVTNPGGASAAKAYTRT
jgi:hypothetical protein